MERVNTRVVYQNPWMVVREDEIRRPDGSRTIFGVVEKPDFALVMPRWRDGFGWSSSHLSHLFEAYGFSTQGFDVYLAEGLAEGEPNRELSEQDMIHRAFTDQEIAGMIRSGQIVDAPSVAALTLFQLERGSGASSVT
jgi:hypothetical protein